MNKRIQKLRETLHTKRADGIFIESPTNRRYVSGFTGTSGAMLITEEEAYFITDFRYVEQAQDQCDGFHIIEQTSSIYNEVGILVKKSGVSRLLFEKEHTTYAVYELLQKYIQAELIPSAGLVENIRLYKEANEIEVLKEAAQIADNAFEHIIKKLKPGVTEMEISNELEFFMRNKGAVSSSFDIIVASGWRGALPHGVASDKVIESGELVTMDYGAYYKGYCSDITRTVAVGEPTNELKKIYQCVYEAQIRAVDAIKPGMSGVEADRIAREYIEQEGYGDHFGHGLGHGLGMEVHEGPRLSPKGKNTLEKGMVVTVEPGIYVSGVGGTRIEDDIVLTENGNERLTHSPKELTIVGE
ncbi:M24 family metallopeptidase [Alteribacillus iranensis]|uniref:Xaa-Pro aminopeptidase n=1 Tax=Alteribacillus iranensis TaxID=930128 RepID=A0A1I1ZG83_9BACI|nr:Xaa-Pro peptidase family protein [Alteribacillus iranensis]SFE30834.1 Xaa-Pro aminopeptidase [Alteribacillus iranensis]